MYAHPLFFFLVNLDLVLLYVLPCSQASQLEREMACFDYGAAAELFPGRHKTRMIEAVMYKRFAAAGASSFLGAFLG
jgi:hypothetical protein